MLRNILHPIVYADVEKIVSGGLLWDRVADKTILISGANGFLASYLVYSFLLANEIKKTNCKVIAVCRSRDNADKKFNAFYERPDFKILVQDISEMNDCEESPHFIIHAASQASPKYYGLDPVGTLKANVAGTQNLLELARKRNTLSFLYFSSSEVYGMMEESKPITETDFGYLDISNVRACYAESKRMGEVMCVSWWKQFGVPVRMVRPFHTYGPGMLLDDGRVYADFVASIVEGKDIRLNSEGTAKRAFCYLSDATIAFLKVLLEGEEGQAYNVGNPEGEKSILQLAELLVGLFPEKKLSVVKNFVPPPGYIASRVLSNTPSIEKIKSLGWMPEVGIEEGFTRTVNSYL